jgi:excisionase family DNA binding protein
MTDVQSPRRRLHTIKEVTAEARVSEATTWRLIKSGRLKTVSIGRRRLIPDENLQQLIERGTSNEAAQVMSQRNSPGAGEGARGPDSMTSGVASAGRP